MDYLYNGIKSSDIYSLYTPERQEKYPYVLLIQAVHGLSLVASNIPFEVINGYVTTKTPVSICDWMYLTHWDGWYLMGEYVRDDLPAAEVSTSGDTRIWSNHDILNEDGSVYLATSDPIPVTSESNQLIDPTSLLMGYLVGQRLRGTP